MIYRDDWMEDLPPQWPITTEILQDVENENEEVEITDEKLQE